MNRHLVLVVCLVLILGLFASQAVAQEYKESPMLAELVKEGKLPPVEERLPEEPFVVGPGVLSSEEWLDWEVGRFGGTMRLAGLSGEHHELFLALGTTILRGPDHSTADPAPALVSSFSHNEDYTEFTMTIRKGLKWSDGVPVTTEDVRFAYEDVYLNEDITPSFPALLRAQGSPAGEPMELEIIDDYTFTIKFDKPYGLFVAELASWIQDYTKLFKPAHFLKQFHIKYTPIEEIQPYLDQEEMDEWWEYIALKDIAHWDLIQPFSVGVPVLTPWVPVEITQDVIKLERNPYYGKVDIAGNQLPYIDYVRSDVINELETIVMRTISGEVDLVTQFGQLRQMPLYRQNEERGNFRVVLVGSINNPSMLFLNHDYDYENEDSVWQQLMLDPEKRFGEALALAMNFEEINNTLYFGMYGEPTVTTAEYNPEKAKALLDDLGMDKLDSSGFRLGPDGEPFELVISVAAMQPDQIPLAELFKEQFEDVGVKTTIQQLGLRLYDERKHANEMMASIHWNDGPIWPSGMSVDYLPLHKGPWAPASYNYYESQGRIGRKPPEHLQEFFDIHDARKQFPPGSEEGVALYAELEEWFGNNYPMIYATGSVTKPIIVSKRLGNVVKDGYPYDRLDYLMEQLFFRE